MALAAIGAIGSGCRSVLRALAGMFTRPAVDYSSLGRSGPSDTTITTIGIVVDVDGEVKQSAKRLADILRQRVINTKRAKELEQRKKRSQQRNWHKWRNL